MTKQETFDTVVNHLRVQGRKAETIRSRSTGLEKICVYRGVDEKGPVSCAVGCLIPDADYEERFEGRALFQLPELRDIVCTKLGHDEKLCCALQNAHDSSDVSSWEMRFCTLASTFGLEYKPL